MSNRTRRRPPTSTARTPGRYDTRPCSDCGAMFALDTRRYLTAVHDCSTDDWYAVPHIATARQRPEDAAA